MLIVYPIVPHSSALKKISSFNYRNNLSVVAISTRKATGIYYSYGSQKFSLNFLVIADSSLSKLLYLPEEKLSDSSECRFFEPD